MQDRLRLVIFIVGFAMLIYIYIYDDSVAIVDVAIVELCGFVGCPKPRMDTALC